MSRRPNMAFIAWTRGSSRAEAISQALDGEAFCVFDLGIQRKALVPLRYLVSAVRTVSFLVRRRPRAVIVQAPPVPAAAVVWAWARLARVPVVFDTHPASFGTEAARVDRLMRPLLAQMVPRTAGCIVTTPRLGCEIERWNGRALVVHEAPMPWRGRLLGRSGPPQGRVLFVSTFAPDEPLPAVLEAARLLPDVRFRVTGDTRRLSDALRRQAPENVDWVGYLLADDYTRELADADVVMSLSERSDSVQRSAHEAVDALRPLVLSGHSHMHELFPHAVFVENTGSEIAEGVREALRRCEELTAAAPHARALQEHRWGQQLGTLRAALALPV